MRGTFSKLPADTLAAALAPVAQRCNQLDWAVDLYSGPLHFHYWNEDDPRNLMSHHHVQEGLPMGWFGRGFLPRYADCLILDEQGYYLGFDSRTLPAAELARRLGGDGRGLKPRPHLFEVVNEHDLLFILRVGTRWWEAYTPDADLLDQIRRGWDGTWVDSSGWDTRPEYPGGRTTN